MSDEADTRPEPVSIETLQRVDRVCLDFEAAWQAERRPRIEEYVAAALQHPNIVAIHEVGQHEGQPFFSMDYVEGRSLRETIREHPLSAWRAARYVKTIAEAVHYAHEQGTLHRDLNPGNVLVDRSDQPWITDFGLAKQVAGAAGLTGTGQVLGTPSYMPPEQARGISARWARPATFMRWVRSSTSR